MDVPIGIIRAKRERQLVYVANVVAHAIVKDYDQPVLDIRVNDLVEVWIMAGV